MIQRYEISIEAEAGCEWINDELEYTNIVPKPCDNGEWVKWEDVKHLMPFQEELEKDIEIILNGNPNAPKPKGIISGGFK